MSTIRLNLFGNSDEETPISPVIQTPAVSLGCVPAPVAFDLPSLPASVVRYVGPEYSGNTPTRLHFCSIRKLHNDMFEETDKEYVTVKDDSHSTTLDGWNDETCFPIGCECDDCIKSTIWSEIPSGATTIMRAVNVAKNEPADAELKCVHPYSLCILSQVKQFVDKFEKTVMHLDDVSSMLFEDFMRINHKLARNASTTTEWINLTGTYMLTNPKYALAYKSIYGNQCCAHVLQHMLVHSDNEHIVEMLRSLLVMKEKCPNRFLERFQKEQKDVFKNLIRF